MTLDEDEFTRETVEYVRTADDERRKEMGQYFTPESVRERLADALFGLGSAPISEPSVLDPACGTGEFLLTVSDYTEDAELVGWELDEEVAEVAREVVPEAEIETTDALREEPERGFDVVIGNPPYFEFDPDGDLRERYSESVYGRVNIYSLFIQKGIEVLRDGGLLAYVVPPSVKNGAYFSAVREYVLKQTEVVHLSTLEDPYLFYGANQTPMLMILRKGGDSDRYVFSKNGVTILSEEADQLRKAFEGAQTLLDMGYEVETGSLVWNRNRDILTEDAEGEDVVPVVWSHNITEDGLVLDNHDKPQYVEARNLETREGPAVAVNRVVGKPGSGSLRACLVPEGTDFVGENHVNLILPPKTRQTTLGGGDDDEILPIGEVLRQLNSEEKTEVLRSITGNTQVSKNEILRLLPFEADETVRSETL